MLTGLFATTWAVVVVLMITAQLVHGSMTLSEFDGRPARSQPRLATLVVIGVLETLTLAVLLINLATRHNCQVAQAIGPVHGLLYLLGIALTWAATKQVRARLLAFVPVAGPLLSAWSVRREERV